MSALSASKLGRYNSTVASNAFNTPVSSPVTCLLGGSDTFLETTLPDARWSINYFRCNDTRSSAAGNPAGTLSTSSGGRVTIPARYVIAGAAFQCVIAIAHKVP